LGFESILTLLEYEFCLHFFVKIVATKFLVVRQIFKQGEGSWAGKVSTEKQTAPSPSGEGAAEDVFYLFTV